MMLILITLAFILLFVVLLCSISFSLLSSLAALERHLDGAILSMQEPTQLRPESMLSKTRHQCQQQESNQNDKD